VKVQTGVCLQDEGFTERSPRTQEEKRDEREDGERHRRWRAAPLARAGRRKMDGKGGRKRTRGQWQKRVIVRNQLRIF
jgi:hypothetical protein